MPVPGVLGFIVVASSVDVDVGGGDGGGGLLSLLPVCPAWHLVFSAQSQWSYRCHTQPKV
jgi:hypothetical protein